MTTTPEPEFFIELLENVITVKLTHSDRWAAAAQHIRWLRAWKSGALAELLERNTPMGKGTNRIRIVSDGTPLGTTVYDAKGEKIDCGKSGIKAIVWAVAVNGEATCSLVLFNAAIDAVGIRTEDDNDAIT